MSSWQRLVSGCWAVIVLCSLSPGQLREAFGVEWDHCCNDVSTSVVIDPARGHVYVAGVTNWQGRSGVQKYAVRRYNESGMSDWEWFYEPQLQGASCAPLDDLMPPVLLPDWEEQKLYLVGGAQRGYGRLYLHWWTVPAMAVHDSETPEDEGLWLQSAVLVDHEIYVGGIRFQPDRPFVSRWSDWVTVTDDPVLPDTLSLVRADSTGIVHLGTTRAQNGLGTICCCGSTARAAQRSGGRSSANQSFTSVLRELRWMGTGIP